VRVATLKQLNDIRDVRRVMPGTVLRLEGDQQAPTSDHSRTVEPQRTPRFSEEPRTRRVGTTPIIINPSVGQQGAKPPVALNSPESRIDNGNSRRPQAGKRYARTEVPVSTSTADPAGKLRWPLSGRIIRGFGKRSDGSQNDGINIAVPVGTDIHAAEAGVVAYAGNELKGYGNLILIRHDNGYVTAYAHGNRMLVRRGDAVRRGQVIAKAGKTGSVSQPQLHFELRKGAKPVDPIPYLSRRL
jgi:murein DD-endopeptidase MepM/ murein hydrolase activator NlpD